MKCVVCGFEIPVEMKFCGMCGTIAAKACPRCAALNPLSYHYCGQCGAMLDRESTEQVDGQLTLLDLNTLLPTVQPLRQLEGERRLATVLMADVFDSTGLLEKIGSEAGVSVETRQVLAVIA